jgi:hypothetical protein
MNKKRKLHYLGHPNQRMNDATEILALCEGKHAAGLGDCVWPDVSQIFN